MNQLQAALRATSLALALFAARPALAAVPSVELAALDDQVAVLARGVRAADGRLIANGARIELALRERPDAPIRTAHDDATIRAVQLVTEGAARLVIETRLAPRAVERLARGGVVETVEGGVRIRLARDPARAELTPGRSPSPARAEPTSAPEATASAAAPTSVTSAPSAAAPALAAAPTTVAAPTTAAAPNEPTRAPSSTPNLSAAAPARSERPTSEAAERSSTDWLGVVQTWLLVLALGSAGVGVVLLARRSTLGRIEAAEIEVVSQRGLGPKARLVLVNVHQRQLLLSVGDQGAQLVTEFAADEVRARPAPPKRESFADIWRRESASIEPPPPQDEVMHREAQPPSEPPKAESPAVTGLLELRRRALAGTALAGQAEGVAMLARSAGSTSAWAERMLLELKKDAR